MKKTGLICLLICLLLTGCGGGDNADSQQSGGISTRQSEDIPAGTEQPAGELLQGESILHEKEVKTVQFQELEEGCSEHSARYKILGKKIYMLRVENVGEQTAARLCVQTYDTESEELWLKLIVPQIPGHENSSIYSADLTAGLELSLKMMDWGTGNSFFLVRMNLEGDILRVTDPFPDEDSYPWHWEFRDDIAAFDLSDGRTVLSRSNMEEEVTRLTWFREDTGAEEPLGTLECGYVTGLSLGGDGMFYYLGNDSLIRWDAEKNISEVLMLRLYANGIEAWSGSSGVIRNEAGDILLCCIQQGKVTIHVLTDKELPDREEIRLCSLQGEAGVGYFQRLAATFTQNGGELPIKMELENRPEYEEDYRTRIMAEMVSGKGPDILYVSQEDMILMQEKGMLCDLSDMIDRETKDVMIPGVLDLGTVNGELVGLVPEVSFVTLGASDKVWTESGWNIGELAGVLKAADSWELPFSQIGIRLDGGSILIYVFLQDLVNSDFLDLGQGTAHFDCEEFIDLLELCKKCGDPRSYEEKMKDQLSMSERTRLLQEGEAVAEVLYLYGGLEVFSDIAQRYGDDAHIVGFPVESGSGCYVDSYSYGYLVVNAQTAYKEEISQFFAQLLSYDNQFKTSGGCVRMDVIRDSVYYDEWMDASVMLRSSRTESNISVQELAVKPDGTSYLEEYLAFVEGCEPVPYRPQQIVTIIAEEVTPFFEGRKNAGEVADIIQSRVQLYLDETR